MSAPEPHSSAARTLDDLYRRHVADVFRYAYAMLGNRSDAEDVAQTTFMNALRALERGERPRKPRSWLFAIAHNLVRQRFRQAQARPTEVELDRELAGVEHDDQDLTIDEMLKALARIPPTQREALVLREFEGRPYSEIADILGITKSALETLLFRARRSLADELASVVTCEQAELAISRQLDARLSRKDRRRLEQHLRECDACARFGRLQRRGRRAFQGLALVPVPASLTLFKATNSAAAAVALPTIGASATAGAGAAGIGAAAGGIAAGGVGIKAAAVVVALGVAGGVSYSGTEIRDERAQPTRPAASVKGEPASASKLDHGTVTPWLKTPGEAAAKAKTNGKAVGKAHAMHAKASKPGRKDPTAQKKPSRDTSRGSAGHPDTARGTPSGGPGEGGRARTRDTKSTPGRTARGKTALVPAKLPKAKHAQPTRPKAQSGAKRKKNPPA
jgi:RNA polymerase sigma factor (sigma-70 family)